MPRGTASLTVPHVHELAQLHVEIASSLIPADVVVVGAPKRFDCRWRLTHCGQAIESSAVPVVVAARSPRPIRSCLILARGAPGDDTFTV